VKLASRVPAKIPPSTIQTEYREMSYDGFRRPLDLLALPDQDSRKIKRLCNSPALHPDGTGEPTTPTLLRVTTGWLDG
jgi:hypothetical protein